MIARRKTERVKNRERKSCISLREGHEVATTMLDESLEGGRSFLILCSMMCQMMDRAALRAADE
jgi:hypothetical protein